MHGIVGLLLVGCLLPMGCPQPPEPKDSQGPTTACSENNLQGQQLACALGHETTWPQFQAQLQAPQLAS